MSTLSRRLLVIAGLILAFLFAGTAGFVLIENYSVFDAFYMSLITMTTVGYMEVQPLSTTGRVFNSFLMLFGVGTMFYAIGAVTQSIIEIQFGDALQLRRVRKMIEKMQDHYIVCGYGRVGRGAIDELRRSNLPFLVLDKNPAKVELAMKAGLLAAAADATRDDSLLEAGIRRARGLIAALTTDADNIFLILSAKSLNPALKVAARAAEEATEAKMRLAGADAVFMPYAITGYRLAQSILRPFVFEFLDITASTSSMGLNVGIEQVPVETGSPMAGKSLREMQLRRELGIIVLAVRREHGEMQFNPPAEMAIHPGDHLIVMGSVEEVRKLEKFTSSGVQA